MQENINIPDSHITANLTFRQLVLMNMQQLTNFPYIEKDFDALTDYELLCLVVKFLNDVIANQNEQNDSITNMYNAFLALQEYVNNTKDTLEDAFNNLDEYVRNYFDNLDVQEEINNKLDQMLEDGVLEQIIEQYIQSTAVWCFDNVADMKLATNFINGSYAQTLGYYSLNDGGKSLYKIRTKTNEDVIDELTIISLYDENLVAELINDKTIKVEQFGITTSNTALSNTTNFVLLLNYLKDGGTILLDNGEYKLNSISIDFEIKDLTIKGVDNKSSIIIKDDDNTNYLFTFNTKTQNLTFENFTIDIDNKGNGLYFKQWKSSKYIANHTYNRFNFMSILHCKKGVLVEGAVYNYFNTTYICLGENATDSDDFALKLDGFEYNFIDKSSFQIWIDNAESTSSDMGLLVADRPYTLYIQNSEFVKTNGYGIKFSTTGGPGERIYIQNNTMYHVRKPILLNATSNDFGFTTIENNYFLKSTTDPAIRLDGTHKIAQTVISHNYTSGGVIVSMAENVTNELNPIILEDNISSYSIGLTRSEYVLNNNYVNLKKYNSKFINFEEEKTFNNASNSHDFYVNCDKLPKIMPMPKVVVNSNASVPVYANITHSGEYDTSNGTYHIVIYHQNLPAGTYKFNTKIITD